MTDMTHGNDFGGLNLGQFSLKRFARKRREHEATERELGNLLNGLEKDRHRFDDADRRTEEKISWMRKLWTAVWSESTIDYSEDEDHTYASQSPYGIQARTGTQIKRATIAAGTGASAGVGGGLFSGFMSVDSLLRIGGLAVALGCGSLPVVVYMLNIDVIGAYSQNVAAAAQRDSQARVESGRDAVSHFTPVDRVDPDATVETNESVAIMSNGFGLPHAEIAAGRDGGLVPTAPLAKPYVLKNVVNGMALIEYDNSYWFAQPGHVLPDGSRYMKAVRDKNTGGWKMRTSKGDVIYQTKS